MSWLSALITLASVVAAILAWAAKLMWAKEYARAKDEVIKAKDSEIAALKSQINGLQEMTPMKVREYYLSVKTQLEEYIDDLSNKLEEAHSQLISRENEINSLQSNGQSYNESISEIESQKRALSAISKNYEFRIEKLTAERDKLFSLIENIISQPQPKTILHTSTMGDTYTVKGQVGAVGPAAHAYDISFEQLWNIIDSEIDLKQLSEELDHLHKLLIEKTETSEQKIEALEILSAEKAAKNGEGAKVLKHLQKAGKWSLEMAEKIGAHATTAAIKSALGL